MRRVQRWSNVKGSWSTDNLEWNLGQLLYVGEGANRRVPECLENAMVGHDYCEFIIEFTSSGYDDPGCMYLRNGDPGYPPESGDEREVTRAYLVRGDDSEHTFSSEEQDVLASFFEKEIYSEFLEIDDEPWERERD